MGDPKAERGQIRERNNFFNILDEFPYLVESTPLKKGFCLKMMFMREANSKEG